MKGALYIKSLFLKSLLISIKNIEAPFSRDVSLLMSSLPVEPLKVSHCRIIWRHMIKIPVCTISSTVISVSVTWGKESAMPKRLTSEAIIEAIIESVIKHSLNGQQEQIVDRTQRTFLDVEANHDSIAMVEEELTELDRDMTRLILDLQAMEERLRARTRPLLQRRQRRTLEGRRRQRVEAGLERSRQRRLHRYPQVQCFAGLVLFYLQLLKVFFLGHGMWLLPGWY